MRRLPIFVAALGLTAPYLLAAAESSPEERTAAYQAFRRAFDTGNYADALQAARQVVDVTRSQSGPEAPDLANPLTNLATTYYRMGEYGQAVDTYREVLTLLDLHGSPTDPRLVRPLHGIGATLLAMQRGEEAIAPLKRAVDITRNRDGLHAASQLPILRALITAYSVAGHAEEVEREEQYAFNVAETAYGRSDIRMLGALEDLARWNEQAGRYSTARSLHARAVQIADAARPNNVLAVNGLRGITRTMRLAFIYGEAQDPATGSGGTPPGRADAAPSGEGALRNALQRLDGARYAGLRAEVLIDLGDWQLIGGKPALAHDTYREAWRTLAGIGQTAVLAQPVPLVYRPPPVAVSQRRESPDEFLAQDVELHISLGPNGEVRDTSVANPAPEREAAERAVSMAIRRSLWRPAMRDGEPVAVSDFLFRELVYVRRARSAS